MQLHKDALRNSVLLKSRQSSGEVPEQESMFLVKLQKTLPKIYCNFTKNGLLDVSFLRTLYRSWNNWQETNVINSLFNFKTFSVFRRHELIVGTPSLI